MSANDDQPHHYDIQTGLALFNNLVVHRATLDGEEKVNDRPVERKDSTTTAPTPPSPKTTPPSNVKLVGSNRFFIPVKK